MEESLFRKKLRTLENPQTLDSLTAEFPEIQVVCIDPRRTQVVNLTGMAPFHTLEDIGRALWVAQDKLDSWLPRNVFIGVPLGSTEGAGGKAAADMI